RTNHRPVKKLCLRSRGHRHATSTLCRKAAVRKPAKCTETNGSATGGWFNKLSGLQKAALAGNAGRLFHKYRRTPRDRPCRRHAPVHEHIDLCEYSVWRHSPNPEIAPG